MPVTQLDPVAALVLIDLQKGVVSMATAQAAQQTQSVVHNSAELARAFRKRGLPVVLVNVDKPASGRTDSPRRSLANLRPDWTEIVPDLEPHATDHRVTKHAPGAFLGTDLDQYLRQRNATQIVLVGISTTAGVESTARSAFDLGFNVVFASDAMTDLSAENHAHALEKIFPRFGEIDTTSAILAKLK
jgi:nicotinamidase-related amidase